MCKKSKSTNFLYYENSKNQTNFLYYKNSKSQKFPSPPPKKIDEFTQEKISSAKYGYFRIFVCQLSRVAGTCSL